MKQTKLLLSVLAIPTLYAFSVPADKVTFSPAADSSVSKTFETEGEFQVDDMSALMNGQEAPIPDLEVNIVWSQGISVTDKYTAVKEGAPTKLRRTYDELGQEVEVEVVVDMSSMGGDTEEDGGSGSGSSDLEGKSVDFTWDEDSSEYKKAFADDEGDEDMLEGLTEDMDLRVLLPNGEVSEGDSWEIDIPSLSSIMAPGGDLGINIEMDDGEEIDGPDPSKLADINRLMQDLLEGEAMGTYKGTRDVDGTTCGVIALAIEIDTAQDLSEMLEEIMGDEMPEEVEASFDRLDLELTLESEGELLWDLRAGHAHSLEINGDVQILIDMGMSIDAGGTEMSMEMTMELSGTLSQSVSVE